MASKNNMSAVNKSIRKSRRRRLDANVVPDLDHESISSPKWDVIEVVTDVVDCDEERNDNVCDAISNVIRSNDANAAPIIDVVVGENNSEEYSRDVIFDGDVDVFQEEQIIKNDNICETQTIPILDLYYDSAQQLNSENDYDISNNKLELMEIKKTNDNVLKKSINTIENNDTMSTDGAKDYVENNFNSKNVKGRYNESEGLLEGQNEDVLEHSNQFIQNTEPNTIDHLDVVEVNELEDLLEEQIMLNYIKKMKSNLPDYQSNSTLCDKSEDNVTDNSKELNDETESILNFGNEDISDKIRKYRERYELISKALTVNAIMQTDLNHFYNYLNQRLIQNKKKQETIKEEIKTLNENKDGKPVNELQIKTYTKFGKPYFKDKKMFTCPSNSDYKTMQLRGQMLALNLNRSRKWRLKDKMLLECGVKDVIVEQETAEWCAEETSLKKDFDDVRDPEIKQEIRCKLELLRTKIDAVQNKNITDLCALRPPGANFPWIRVSADHVLSHSEVECERMWYLYVNPAVNKKKWTNEEDIKLLQLAEEQNYQDWDLLAEKLGTSRSGYQCFINYQTRLNKYIKNSGKWTADEDQRLCKIVSKCRVGDYIPWSKISYYFQGRTLPQLYTRWNSSLNPELKKGRFSRQEDRMIVLFVRKFGEDFGKISKMFGDRTSVQLRERYLRAVRMKYQNTGRWSLEEDKLLLSLVKTYGERNWSAISKNFISRSRTQIRQRYQAITNSLLKQPDIKIEDFHRGPKAKSQVLLTAVKVEREKQETQMLNVVGKEAHALTLENIKLISNIKKGRKKIVRRQGIDSKLVSYFREAYSTDKLKHNTRFVKPDNVEKTAVAMLIFCRFMQTHVNEEKLENATLKKLPITLRNVITKMKEMLMQWGCDCLTTSPSKPSHVCVCLQYSPIDCFPNKRRSTIIEDESFILSSLPEYEKACLDKEWECICLKNKIKHILPYYLPPNLITTVGFRSALIMKDKIAHSLSYDKIRKGYFSNFDLEIQSHGLKKFTGFFTDESDGDVDENNAKRSDVYSKFNNLFSKNNAIDQVTSLPSTQVRPIPVISLYPESSHSKKSESASYFSYGDSDLPQNKTIKRLTHQDAVNLWKERLLAVLAWPIILSNQSADPSEETEPGIEVTTEMNNLNNVHGGGKSCSYSRKRKTEPTSFLNKVKILETNEVLKTKPIVIREKRKAFQLFEDPPSDDNGCVDEDACVEESDNDGEKRNESDSSEPENNEDAFDCNKVFKVYNKKAKSCEISQFSSDKGLSMLKNFKLNTASVKSRRKKKMTKHKQ